MRMLITLGWRVYKRHFQAHKLWTGDFLYCKDNCVLILETRRAPPAAHITADLIGTRVQAGGYRLYYGHLDANGYIYALYQWRPENHIPTLVL